MKVASALLLLTASFSLGGPIAREPGVIYLSDFEIKDPRFPLTAGAPCYFDSNMKRYAGTLRFPQRVELDAVSPAGMYRVRGNARQGGVAAWIEPRFLGGVPEDLVPKLRSADERRRQVEALIARNEVAIGMTLDEVARSLGKPQKRSSTTNRGGSTQTFEYVRYKLIPQTVYTPTYAQTVLGIAPDRRRPLETVVLRGGGYGLNASTVYVKVPVGTINVSFLNGIVESIEESEGTLVGANASIVVPPVNVVW
ncbi:MAG: hypothetical protein JHD33_08275 [Chthoniobacterales bacterium]|nr:hypothetical protein [Chthoniobacterales bacterium]